MVLKAKILADRNHSMNRKTKINLFLFRIVVAILKVTRYRQGKVYF